MNKERLFLLIAFLILFVTSSCASTNNLEKDRKELADNLGVSLEDYPPETAFPGSYFHTRLKEGMTLNEVHDIIKGYDKVYHCWNGAEIYYFYGTDDDTAFRFMILYDENHHYFSSQTEDDDSRYFVVKDCTIGLLE